MKADADSLKEQQPRPSERAATPGSQKQLVEEGLPRTYVVGGSAFYHLPKKKKTVYCGRSKEEYRSGKDS